MKTEFSREIHFDPAWDRRNDDPNRNYGVHGVSLRMYLKGPKGVIQFVVYTNWHLPHVTKEHSMRHYAPIGGDPHWMERPMPADIGYHSPVPRYEGQKPMGACSVLDGGQCFYDGSTLNAEPIFEILLREGDEGVWRELERWYRRTFEDE